jgi:hypothetical protein
MKYHNVRFVLLIGGLTAGLFAQTAQTTIITPPAVKDGSNQSRAPFPSQRKYDDVKAPDGQAIDKNIAPNTDATNPEPFAPPPARVAILQPRTPAEPALAMTGRPTIGLATSLDAARLAPTIRAESMTSRDQLLTDIESRLTASDKAMRSFEQSTREMSAENRAAFKTAADDVKAKEKAVRKDLKAARKANDRDWESARAALAADYEAYAEAAGRVDAAAGIPPVQIQR